MAVDASDTTTPPAGAAGSNKQLPLATLFAAIFGDVPVGTARSLDTAYRNTSGRTRLVTYDCGVVCDPGENGHIYFDLSPDNTDWTTYQKQSYVGNRQTIENLGQNGHGGMLFGIVPNNWYFRFRTY